MSKYLFISTVALMVCVICPVLAVAEETADVSGEWNITLQFSLGSANHTAIIEQDGELLSGTYKGQFLEGTLRGKIEGNKIDFTGYLRNELKGIRFHFMGTVDGGTIKWRDDYEYDEMNVDWADYWRGEFTAKRPKK